MKKIRQLLTMHHIRTKIILSVLICGVLLLLAVEFMLNDSLSDLETELVADRLSADIHYIGDLIGEGEWSLRDGALYRGDTLVGDGTKENANLTPFLACEEKTGTFSYTFVICSDDGLGWTGDEKTGYQQGHYLRVAGSTLSPTGESIVGTYMDKEVADVLDACGTYAGEANVVGGRIYCLYETLRDADGNTVGVIVVGRSIHEMQEQIREGNRRAFWVIIGVLALTCLGLTLVISRWVGAIGKVQSYLEKIGSGEFPDEPLRLDTQDEMGLMADSVNSMAVSLQEKERIGAELELATNIQAHMLPCIFPPFPDHDEFDIFASMAPAREVGGDFYDFFMLDDRHLAVVIADVSGKGVPAALFMVIAKTLIKNYTQMGLTPGNVFTKVNQLLCEGNEAGLFVTAWMGVLDIQSGMLTYVNAGHNPPMIRQGGGDFAFLRSRPGFVLAGMDTVRYKQNELQMQPGDKLFLYTDGVTEATAGGSRLFGEERLSCYLNAHPEDSADETVHGLRAEIDRFVGDAQQFDDITMLMLDYRRRGDAGTMLECSFPAADAALAEVDAFVQKELEKVDCPAKAAMQITVAVEEIFINIAHYAYPEIGGRMLLGVEATPEQVRLRFSDYGFPFNPLERNDPDITLSAEDRDAGGLGIFMVKKTMDEVSYERKNNQNVFTIVKRLR